MKENIPATKENCEELIERLSVLSGFLETLSARKRKIIKMRKGLDDGIPKTIEETVREVGSTRERIRQIENEIPENISHEIRIGDVLEKIAEANAYSEKWARSWNRSIVKLWKPCGFSKSLQTIIEESGWEEVECSVSGCECNNHGVAYEHLKDKNARDLLSFLLEIFK